MIMCQVILICLLEQVKRFVGRLLDSERPRHKWVNSLKCSQGLRRGIPQLKKVGCGHVVWGSVPCHLSLSYSSPSVSWLAEIKQLFVPHPSIMIYLFIFLPCGQLMSATYETQSRKKLHTFALLCPVLCPSTYSKNHLWFSF